MFDNIENEDINYRKELFPEIDENDDNSGGNAAFEQIIVDDEDEGENDNENNKNEDMEENRFIPGIDVNNTPSFS